jgi:hypothetical protein
MATGMKLCAVWTVWADYDLLEHSVENIAPLVDGIIIVASTKSNYGEVCEIPDKWKDKVMIHEPALLHPSHAETRKRNFGLDIARRTGYTHYLNLDADELYERKWFYEERKRFDKDPNLQGLVCASQVYVKSPTLTIGLDTTLVPFIHKITPTLKHEFNRSYPFAWEGRNLRVDPTRSFNINSGVEWSSLIMHHYSHVRSDYARKIRNSTAKANLERMNLANKIVHLKEGDIFDLYPGKPLVRVPNRFAIPEYGELAQDHNL